MICTREKKGRGQAFGIPNIDLLDHNFDRQNSLFIISSFYESTVLAAIWEDVARLTIKDHSGRRRANHLLKEVPAQVKSGNSSLDTFSRYHFDLALRVDGSDGKFGRFW